MTTIVERQLRLQRIERGVVRLLARVRKLKALHHMADGVVAEVCLECKGEGIVYRACCSGVENGSVVCGCYGRDIPEPCDCQTLDRFVIEAEEILDSFGIPVYGGPL